MHREKKTYYNSKRCLITPITGPACLRICGVCAQGWPHDKSHCRRTSPTTQKGLALSLMCCSHCLEILHFGTRGPVFPLTLGSANDVTDSDRTRGHRL